MVAEKTAKNFRGYFILPHLHGIFLPTLIWTHLLWVTGGRQYLQ